MPVSEVDEHVDGLPFPMLLPCRCSFGGRNKISQIRTEGFFKCNEPLPINLLFYDNNEHGKSGLCFPDTLGVSLVLRELNNHQQLKWCNVSVLVPFYLLCFC